MNENGFNFSKFIDDSKNVLLKPKEFFPSLSLEGGFVEPIIKAAIYGAVAGFFYMIWSFLHVGAAVGGFLGTYAGVGALVFAIIGAVIGVFIGGIILLILSSICGGNNNFEANVRVTASIMVIYPVSAFLAIFSGLNFYLGALIGLAINLYSLYLIYIALSTVLAANEKTARTVSYILAALLVLFLIIGMGARKAATTFTGLTEQKLEERVKELEKIGKELEDVAEESVEMDDYYKPEKFPAEACEKFKDVFYDGDPVVNAGKLEKLVDATMAIKEYENTQTEEILKTLQANGFETAEEYVATAMQSAYGFQTLGGLFAIQHIIDSPKDEQVAAEAFTMDVAMEEMVKQMVNAGKFTEEDMHTLYDNWSVLVEMDKNTKE
ncbi:MAG TPA: Yip1 family protein [Tenuifilaceae bacterium]|nr:Yip1 family protein [Tenuifilaceae bacterium]HPE18454.1 Yip1 family protein [Tenuifilaceae bacterium]HPJ45664.1 Yip1 family protein [Tenuifilaceae bacterium]HPQ34170.1 Yip1 family protein [Tenuifilaceae bacterium]HRX67254.1 Yip1 family protein [Tenuifilaceae bacterium]